MIDKGRLINNRYKIISLVGMGGMAMVYLAWDTLCEREVVVKTVRDELSNDENSVRRFHKEVEFGCLLKHPNIVKMYDAGEENGTYFMIMEYIKGKTLNSFIKKRVALNLKETIGIMLQITSAIAYLHDIYIIHGDIKPLNILILEDGRIKIIDFGFATSLNNDEINYSNPVIGSIHYLSPEQVCGVSPTIKSDIYSLGIIMFELLAGHVPFKGNNAIEIAIQHMKAPIPSICSINSTIPQSIENIILKSTAKNPRNRYNSVHDIFNDLKVAFDSII